jgi:hypothetical protein
VKTALGLPLFMLVAALLFLPGQRNTRSESLVFTHITVIDATGAAARPEMTVVITRGRIAELGPTNRIRVPQDAQLVDATGKFLIPGLWDMHVHVSGVDSDYLQLYIANGITGVRIMWGSPVNLQWRKEIEAGTRLGPRLVIASTIVDGPKPIWPGSINVANETEGRQAVIKLKQDGYDFIKVYSLLSRAAYFAIADEAKKQGIPFAGHVPFSVTVAEASDAGQRTIEHVTGFLAACSTREGEWSKEIEDAFASLPPGQRFPSPARTRSVNRLMLDTFSPEKAARLFSRLKRNHTWQCPTLTILRSGAFLNDPNFRADPRLKYMPARIRTMWDPTTDFRFKQRTADDFDLARLTYEKQIQLVGMLHRAGVELLAGTDAPNPYCFPGFSLHDELELLVKAGLTPMSALQAATITPARFLGQEKNLGTVEKNKIADLLLLEGNPLEDIRNTQRINAVVIRGKLIPKAELEQMLAAVEAAAKTR